jgi:hypothetical protein
MSTMLTKVELAVAERLRRLIYARPDGGAGCCWHILLDDSNVDDENVNFCVDLAKQRGHDDCIALGYLVVRMSKTQRKKLAEGGYEGLVEEIDR